MLRGGALNIAKKDLAQSQLLLEQLKTSNGTVVISGNQDNSGTQGGDDMILGSHKIGGIDTVDVLAAQVLCTNTLSNAV